MTKTQMLAKVGSKVRALNETNMPAGSKKAVYLRLVSIGEIPKKNQLPPDQVDAFFGIAEK